MMNYDEFYYIFFNKIILIFSQTSLKMLDISGNGIESLEDISIMSELRVLNAEDNLISDLESISKIISLFPNLQSLDLKGNPVAKMKKYRETIISNVEQ